VTPVGTDRLGRALARLDDDERAAFVAAVWAARGYAVSTRGGVVTARRDGEAATRVAASPSVAPSSAVDAVLAVGRERRRVPEDARTLDAAAVRRLLLYAVDRDRGATIAREHLGVPLLTPEPEPEPGNGSARGGRSVRLVLAAVVVLGGVVVASLVAGVSVPGAGGSTPTAPGAGDDRNVVKDPPPPNASLAVDDPYPPGLSARGVVDASALGEAHAVALAGRSYRLIVRTDGVAPLTHPGEPFAPGIDRWGDVYQRASVANATHYDYRLGGTCTPVGEDDAVTVTRTAYADGVAQYSRSRVGGVETRDVRPVLARAVDGNGVRPDFVRSRGGVPDVRPVLVRQGRVGLVEVRAARAIERLVATPRSTVRLVRVNGTPRYLLSGSGAPPGLPDDVGNYSMAARVRGDGLVEAFTVGYTHGSAADRESVVVSIEYHALGRTTVDPPGWFETAGGAAGFPSKPSDAANASLRGARRCGLPISNR
jgi:hypothetical protein